MSTTLFIQPTATIPYTPNYANANATGVSFTDYSPPVTGSLTTAEANSLVNGGVAAAIGEASSIFVSDANFTALFGVSDGFSVGIEDSYEGKTRSETKVIATFDMSSERSLTFNFAAGVDIDTKEIDNPQAEDNKGRATSAFLVLDTTNPNPRVLGYYGIKGSLASAQQDWMLKEGKRKGARRSISNVDLAVSKNIDGNDGVDSLGVSVSGTYQQTFKPKVTRVTLVQQTKSFTKVKGDTLIGNLGAGVIYGSLKRDVLTGTQRNDVLYGSLGNDKIKGKEGDDIIEGGLGNDKLLGNAGNDKLHGSEGDDVINPGKGSDVMAGGTGADRFVIKKLKAGDINTILDFEVGVDKVQQLGITPRQQVLENMIDTGLGAQFTSSKGGQVVFTGLSVADIGSTEALFV